MVIEEKIDWDVLPPETNASLVAQALNLVSSNPDAGRKRRDNPLHIVWLSEDLQVELTSDPRFVGAVGESNPTTESVGKARLGQRVVDGK
jgi:hypothetical protein